MYGYISFFFLLFTFSSSSILFETCDYVMETTSALGGLLLHEASMEAGQLVGATSGTSYWDISK